MNPRPPTPADAAAPDTMRGRAEDRLRLDVIVEANAWLAFGAVEAAIEQAVAALACDVTLPADAAEASIALADDATVQRLNRDFRGFDKPTNVLSFPAIASPHETAMGAPHYLGDIILAAETVALEADEQAIPVLHHIQHLTIHGVLHLLGYDHVSDADAARMEALETRVLARLGVSDPYAEDREPSTRTTGP